jgi:hypothetical protein
LVNLVILPKISTFTKFAAVKSGKSVTKRKTLILKQGSMHRLFLVSIGYLDHGLTPQLNHGYNDVFVYCKNAERFCDSLKGGQHNQLKFNRHHINLKALKINYFDSKK